MAGVYRGSVRARTRWHSGGPRGLSMAICVDVRVRRASSRCGLALRPGLTVPQCGGHVFARGSGIPPVSTAASAEAAWLVLRRLQGSNGVEMSKALVRRARGGCDHATRGAAVASGELVGQGGAPDVAAPAGLSRG